ncbi:MAG: heavy metal translocating P-type ATPase, partial [Clostridiales bacterium]|nr:heavy metal translocating P-type ATPase [Clostridiales bacterium]
MRIRVLHELKGRIRFSTDLGDLTAEQADQLQYYLLSLPGVRQAKVYDRSGNAVVQYEAERRALLRQIMAFSLDDPALEALVPEHTSRQLNQYYREKLLGHVLRHAVLSTILPPQLRAIKAVWKFYPYLMSGLHCLRRRRLEVPVLDATAIAVSLLRRDFKTAASVMFLLRIGELMEEWTHKKSVADLASSMALHVEKVWKKSDHGKELVPIQSVCQDDLICVEMGSMIPLDGVVVEGEAMVNQASLTGESVPVRKSVGAAVYAGTALEEGNLVLQVKQAAGSTRYEKIVRMIEDSERLKSNVESDASHLADRLVPLSFLGTVLTYLLTRNLQKAVSILMVDFSCALKLSMPVAVLSAMRECSGHQITVKGGKFLEAVAKADTIVFDKTGTLTKAQPTVKEVICFHGTTRDEMLRVAACLEEHFPHSIANAVVRQAELEGLKHAEMHSRVKYVIAHGIASEIDGQHVCIGSRHFVFEDEGCTVDDAEQAKLDALPDFCSHLYLAIGGKLMAVLCIEDPLREESAMVVHALKALGIGNVVMMTGDNEATARAIAKQVGVDTYFAEVLP